MMYFFADDHYESHPGKVIYENLPADLKSQIRFYENDWSVLESGAWLSDCKLLILNLIGTTCNLPHPGPGAEKAVRKWCEKGGAILMLHGSSAAFWQWDWWRKIVGFRWVRPNDPDGIAASTHPKKPYSLTVSKTRHPLTKLLEPIELPTDEIYINMEQVCPAVTLMETHIEEGTFPQCSEAVSPWNGKLVNFIPGHAPEVTSNPKLIRNVAAIIEYLLKGN